MKESISLLWCLSNGNVSSRNEYKQSNQIFPEIRLDIVPNQGVMGMDKSPIRVTFVNASTKSEVVVLVSKYQILSQLLKSVCPYQDASYDYWIKNGIISKKLIPTGNISVIDAGIVDGSIIELTVNKLVIKNFDRALEQSLMSHQEKEISTPSTEMDYSFRCDAAPQHFQLTPDLMQHYNRHFETCKKNSRDPAIDLDYKALKYVFKELVKLRTVISKDLRPRKSSTEQLN
jgi:hypothetical protein